MGTVKKSVFTVAYLTKRPYFSGNKLKKIFMENKYVYHIKTQEEFDRYIGGRNSSGTDGGGWKVWAGSCLGVLAIPIIEYALGKGIDALGKLITDNNKTNSKLTEIEAKGKADCRKIETQGEVKCKIIDKETEGKCKIIKTQGEEKRQTMQKEHDLKKDFYDYKQAEKEKKQQQKQAKSSPGLDEWLQQYRQAVPQADTRLAEEYALIFPWLTEGYDIGLVAPTNCGKTTLMMQVAMDLTRGEYTHKLAPGCSKIQPVRVLYFALEQSQKDIDRHYGNIRNTLPMLTVYDGATWKTADMIEIIKREMMACRGRGVVVIIDNWTKLCKKNKQATADIFWNDLDELRMASSQTTCPLTTIKVFHTKKDYKKGEEIQLEDCRGYGEDLDNMQNILYLTSSNRGREYRVQGYLKLKDGDETELNLLRWANTQPNQFEYAGPATLDDIGNANKTVTPSEAAATEETSPVQVKEKKRRGPTPHFTIEQAVAWWNEVKNRTSTWAQIEERTGFKKAAIKKRAKPYMPKEDN